MSEDFDKGTITTEMKDLIQRKVAESRRPCSTGKDKSSCPSSISSFESEETSSGSSDVVQRSTSDDISTKFNEITTQPGLNFSDNSNFVRNKPFRQNGTKCSMTGDRILEDDNILKHISKPVQQHMPSRCLSSSFRGQNPTLSTLPQPQSNIQTGLPTFGSLLTSSTTANSQFGSHNNVPKIAAPSYSASACNHTSVSKMTSPSYSKSSGNIPMFSCLADDRQSNGRPPMRRSFSYMTTRASPEYHHPPVCKAGLLTKSTSISLPITANNLSMNQHTGSTFPFPEASLYHANSPRQRTSHSDAIDYASSCIYSQLRSCSVSNTPSNNALNSQCMSYNNGNYQSNIFPITGNNNCVQNNSPPSMSRRGIQTEQQSFLSMLNAPSPLPCPTSVTTQQNHHHQTTYSANVTDINIEELKATYLDSLDNGKSYQNTNNMSHFGVDSTSLVPATPLLPTVLDEYGDMEF